MPATKDCVGFIAFDPGGRTGYATTTIDIDTLRRTGSIREAMTNTMYGFISEPDFSTHIADLVKLLRSVENGGMPYRCRSVLSVIESFNVRPNVNLPQSAYLPIRIIGAMHYAVSLLRYPPLEEQQPSLRVSVTNERLGAWGIPIPQQKDALSAMQHLVTFLRRRQPYLRQCLTAKAPKA